MSVEAPKLGIRLPGRVHPITEAGDVVGYLEERLQAKLVDDGTPYRPRANGGAGWAMTRLFGRLAELLLTRLHKVPDQHFRAFLNAAGVHQLPARGARAELTFSLPDDGPALVRVPAGTQVATAQTETQPEVIFETASRLVVAPNQLVRCVAFDPLRSSDRTAIAIGATAGSFNVFRGQSERQRVLYLGDDELFTFADDASRQAATITLSFAFDRPAVAEADWELSWLYWDGAAWSDLRKAGATVEDDTVDFRRDGTVTLSGLPALVETEVGGTSGLWIACRLTGGTQRRHLPELASVKGERTVTVGADNDWANANTTAADTAFAAVQGGAAVLPLDPADEFRPLGQQPGRLDTFYLRSDEAFAKADAAVRLYFDLEGVPDAATSEELAALTVVWDYYGSQGWTRLGQSQRGGASDTGFEDTSQAFTAGGSRRHVGFPVKSDFAETEVEGEKGLWVRARVVAGSYDVPASVRLIEVPGEEPGTVVEKVQEFLPPATYAPLISKLEVTYTGYQEKIDEKALDRRHGQVDSAVTAFSGGGSFAPFIADDEGPALYLGFQAAFPADEWIQLLLDVDESGEARAADAEIGWEYWNGSRWRPLRVSDGSEGLSRRGYLGFFAPDDHRASTEFGQTAYWIQAYPSHPPQARVSGRQTYLASDGEAKVRLDASRAVAFGHRVLESFFWRLLSSRPIADPGGARDLVAQGEEATVRLDAAPSQGAGGVPVRSYRWSRAFSRAVVADPGKDRTTGPAEDSTEDTATVRFDASGSRSALAPPIVSYRWRLAESRALAEEEEEDSTVPTLFLGVVRWNTVSARNAATLEEEVLGASDGKADQPFRLLRPPVLEGPVLAVREHDRPPDDELKALDKELQAVDETATALLSGNGTGEDVWVRWHQVRDFHDSGPTSRHYVLDHVEGEVLFGDGERGMIPPVGRDNVKMVRYHTHDGAQGNAAAGTITVLRNPSGALADVQSVTNPEAAAGGSAEETVAEVEERGPKALKHRGRAVTLEDFEALAREASAEVAQARCLPARDSRSLTHAGWVTVVILPRSTDAKPTPRPSLVRLVRGHLEEKSLTNLEAGAQIHVQGPDYVEATVRAKVVAEDPTRADEIKLAVIRRLESFFHPLAGGPQGEGWALGRDVVLSEVYAEVEAVSGVDYVREVLLEASLQQLRVIFESPYATVPFPVPEGSQVGTFDESSRLLLARPLKRGAELREALVYGFRADDKVELVRSDDTLVEPKLVVASLAGDRRLTFTRSFVDPGGRDWALRSESGLLRLPVADAVLDADGKVSGVRLEPLAAGDQLSIVAGHQRREDLDWLAVRKVETVVERVFVPAGHLPYSGGHDVEMTIEEE